MFTLEWPAATRVWSWGKQIFTEGRVYAARFATLEARVIALETALAKQPAEACPFCGERAMRMTHESGILGGPPNQWRQEWWACKECGKSDARVRKF